MGQLGPELSGMVQALGDLLGSAVRSNLDERVLVSAHNHPGKGKARVTVSIYYRVPSADPEHVNLIIDYLGRRSGESRYYRLPTAEGAWPVRARQLVRTIPTKVEHGETRLVTTITAHVEALHPETLSRLRLPQV